MGLRLYIRVESLKKREEKMTTSCYQLNIFAMQQRINKFNKQLLNISDRRSLIAVSQNQIIQKYQKSFEMENIGTENAAFSTPISWDQDPQVILLSNEDNALDMEAESIETQLNALQKDMEAMEKAQEKCIKNGVAKLA